MKRNVLKIFGVLLIAFLLSVGSVCVSASETDIQTGECGDDLRYSFSNGVLTISGTGEMWDFRNEPGLYDYHESPWEDWKLEIEQIVFQPGITYIGADAFCECENLEKVTFADTVTKIGSFSFMRCKKLENFTLPKKLQTLGQQAFDDCDKITSVKIPDTIAFLDGSVFSFCDALTYAYIGGSTEVGSYVFGDAPFRCCGALERIEVSPDNFALTAVDGVLYTKDLKTLVQYPAGKKDQTYTLLATTERIYPLAVEYNPYVETVVLPEALRSIDDSAFSECANLKYFRYAGTEAQWAEVAIDPDNRALAHVAVSFNSGCKHSYTNACDASCNVCYARRTVKHSYTNACDTTCNVCNAKRTVKHTYTNNCDATCNVCNAKRTAKHTYTNSCDTTCNACKAKRTITHTYTNACDKTCNVCKAKRTIKHTYTNACDATCNVCKAKRSIKHRYKTSTTKATLSENGSVIKQCTVCGKVASNTTVKYAKSFKLSATAYTYNKKAKKPTVTVKDAAGKTLKKNTDYTVSYQSGRKNVGTYKVTVEMKGKYSGTKVLTFRIDPAKTTVSKLTAGKRSITVAITKKTAQVTGYQIQYATNKSFSDAITETIPSYKTTKYKLEGLQAKKKYYVKVRTYKQVGDTVYYSGWSSYKQVKTQ